MSSEEMCCHLSPKDYRRSKGSHRQPQSVCWCRGAHSGSTKGGERGLILQCFILASGYWEGSTSWVAIPFLKTERPHIIYFHSTCSEVTFKNGSVSLLLQAFMSPPYKEAFPLPKTHMSASLNPIPTEVVKPASPP